MLDRSGVLAVIGELVTAAMAQHMAVSEETEASTLASSGDHIPSDEIDVGLCGR